MTTELPRHGLLPIDLLAVGLNLLFAVLHLFFLRHPAAGHIASVPENLLFSLGFLIAAALIAGLVAMDARGWLRAGSPQHFLRSFAVQLCYPFWFMRVIVLSQLISNGASFDPLFAALEEALFGVQLALVLPERFGRLRWLNEIMYFAYFSYYLLLSGCWWVLYARRRYRDAMHALFVVTASFAVLYVWYLVFPVHGPKYYFPELRARWYSDLDGYLFAAIMRWIFADANLAGAAVPSSHVAISLTVLVLCVRLLPRLAPAIAVVTLLLWVSTVYLYAHYAVDVLLGLVVVPPLLAFSWWLSIRLHGRLPACRTTGRPVGEPVGYSSSRR